MILGYTGLISGYAFLLLLILLVLIYSNLHWAIKSAVMTLSLGFFVITYYSFTPLMGWPVSEELPDELQFQGAYIRQPNKITGSEGGIYLWAVNLNKNISQQLPRAYRLPYSDPLHEKVVEAKRKTKNGVPQMIDVVGDVNTENERKSQATNQGGGGTIVPVEFYDMPVTTPPAKG